MSPILRMTVLELSFHRQWPWLRWKIYRKEFPGEYSDLGNPGISILFCVRKQLGVGWDHLNVQSFTPPDVPTLCGCAGMEDLAQEVSSSRAHGSGG
jgi:hypothetical protein